MTDIVRHVSDLPEELVHRGTTHRKRLIRVDDHKQGDIATVNYAWLSPGKQLEPHIHEDGEEYYYFLDGHGTILVGSRWYPVSAGDFVTVPLGHAHSVKNQSDRDLVFLTIRTVVPRTVHE